MSSFPLRTVILPAVLVSSAVFSTLTLPFVLLKEPITIDIPPLLSGGRIEPMFDAENKDVAIRYVGIAILFSVGAGIGTVELLRARHSAQELTQTKNQLSSLKLSLQEKSGQADGSQLLDPEDDSDLSEPHDAADRFDADLDEESESLTSTFDQYVAAESLGKNLDAFPLVRSKQPTESLEVTQAVASSADPTADLPASLWAQAIQQDIGQDKPGQNGHDPLAKTQQEPDPVDLNRVEVIPEEALPAIQMESHPTDIASFNGGNGGHSPAEEEVVNALQSGYSPFYSEALQDADWGSGLTAASESDSYNQYQTCRIRVPHLKRRLFAVLVQGKYFSLFRSGMAQESALEIAAKLEHRGDKPIVTQTHNGYAVWIWQAEAIVDEVTA
ncbi:hypothetical protein H6F93_28785 [Leptolyngbya sp. FACHB-671]|uniref:hypothetical protein n=1 Tax=Leptolyngbya sp. FACHB-671 TaxID=2692812 RepID=UPI0016851F1C|nr:hypothetical protein [Leptolyngbya sp. FACHB-671]MBD2071465.1 hypothetical protein [Leptolyngbya sp. FACHB-671]